MGKEQRKHACHKVSIPGMILGIDGNPIVGCRVRNVSESGVQVALDREATLPQEFVLAMSRDSRVLRACTLVWRVGIMAGASLDYAPRMRSFAAAVA